jgi:hypothetical protein
MHFFKAPVETGGKANAGVEDQQVAIFAWCVRYSPAFALPPVSQTVNGIVCGPNMPNLKHQVTVVSTVP